MILFAEDTRFLVFMDAAPAEPTRVGRQVVGQGTGRPAATARASEGPPFVASLSPPARPMAHSTCGSIASAGSSGNRRM